MFFLLASLKQHCLLMRSLIPHTHTVSVQLAQDLFGLLFGLSLLLLNVDDGAGGAVGRVPCVIIHTWQTCERSVCEKVNLKLDKTLTLLKIERVQT